MGKYKLTKTNLELIKDYDEEGYNSVIKNLSDL